MSPMRERTTVAAVAVVALLCGGCGGGEKPAPTPSGEISIGTPMTIFEPTDEKDLKATRSLPESLRLPLTVRGRSEPDATVVVNSGCAVEVCADQAKAAIDGAWEAHVQVMVDRSAPLTTVTAINSADPSDQATVTVRVHGAPPPKVVTKKHPKPKPKPTTTATPTPAPTPRPTPPRSLVMIGDSLAVGTEPYLSGLLPGWAVRTDAKTSRPLATGMQILANASLGSGPVALAFSLFTNDGPGNVSALESAVRASVQRAGPNGCAIWATIARPPYNGVSYAPANRRLQQLAAELSPRLFVVPWAAAVAANPSWVGRDGVHATATGYRARAELYAEAARSCGG
jgi:hypothetical protein